MAEPYTASFAADQNDTSEVSAAVSDPIQTPTPDSTEPSSLSQQSSQALGMLDGSVNETPKTASLPLMDFNPRWSILPTAEVEASLEWSTDPRSFINISIIDYEKHDVSSVSNPFITYGIQTKTNWPVFSTQEFTVRRRYNDFLWLRGQLQKVFPTVFVPPIPEKQVSDRFSPEFVAKRRRMLERFLLKVTQHPKLRTFVDLHIFLEAKSWALETLKQSRGGDVNESSARGKRSSFKMPKVRNQNPQFSDMGAYINEFEYQITQLERFCSSMQKAKKDLAQGYFDFGAMLTLLSNTEVELADSFACTGGIIEQSGKYLEQEVRSDEENFQETLHMYVLYLEGIQEAIRKRNITFAYLKELEIELHALKPPVSAQASTQEEKHEPSTCDKVGQEETPTEQVSEQVSEQPAETPVEPTLLSPRKSGSWFSRLFQRDLDSSSENGGTLAKSAKDIEYIVQLELKIQQAQIEQEKMDAELLQEYTLFHQNKVDDFVKMLDVYSKCQINHHRDAHDAWVKLQPVLEKVKKR